MSHMLKEKERKTFLPSLHVIKLQARQTRLFQHPTFPRSCLNVLGIPRKAPIGCILFQQTTNNAKVSVVFFPFFDVQKYFFPSMASEEQNNMATAATADLPEG